MIFISQWNSEDPVLPLFLHIFVIYVQWERWTLDRQGYFSSKMFDTDSRKCVLFHSLLNSSLI